MKQRIYKTVEELIKDLQKLPPEATWDAQDNTIIIYDTVNDNEWVISDVESETEV